MGLPARWNHLFPRQSESRAHSNSYFPWRGPQSGAPRSFDAVHRRAHGQEQQSRTLGSVFIRRLKQRTYRTVPGTGYDLQRNETNLAKKSPPRPAAATRDTREPAALLRSAACKRQSQQHQINTIVEGCLAKKRPEHKRAHQDDGNIHKQRQQCVRTDCGVAL